MVFVPLASPLLLWASIPKTPAPRLYQTEPGGIYSAWKANAIGRSSKTVREFLEKNHKDDMTRDDTIKLTIKSLLEVVQTGAKNIEIAVMESYGKVTNLDLAQIEANCPGDRARNGCRSVTYWHFLTQACAYPTLQRRSGSARGWQQHPPHRLP